MSQVSTVPKRISPRSARSLTPGTLSRIHFIFVPEKYASMTRPVFCRNFSVSPLSFKKSQYSEVLRHCQTMAWYTGSPVFRSQTMAVSRWFVIPMAAISAAAAPILFIASTATPSWLAQISSASCSTHPGCGKYWVNSLCAMLHIFPVLSNRMHRLLVVPASSAMIYFGI